MNNLPAIGVMLSCFCLFQFCANSASGIVSVFFPVPAVSGARHSLFPPHSWASVSAVCSSHLLSSAWPFSQVCGGPTPVPLLAFTHWSRATRVPGSSQAACAAAEPCRKGASGALQGSPLRQTSPLLPLSYEVHCL